MKKALAFMLALLLLAGLSAFALAELGTDNLLIGQWSVDPEYIPEQLVQAVGMEPELAAAMAPYVTISFEFKEDKSGIFTVKLYEQTNSRVFQYVAVENVASENYILLDSALYTYTLTEDKLTLDNGQIKFVLLRDAVPPAPEKEAGLEIVQHNAHYVVTSFDTSEYVYAKVQNNSDEPLYLDKCVLKLMDESGAVFATEEYAGTYVEYLHPGEYTYVSFWLYESEVPQKPADYSLDVTWKKSGYVEYKQFQVSTSLSVEKDAFGDDTTYMYTIVENNSNDVVYDIQVVSALLDEQGNILYMTNNMLFDVGILPGTSFIFRKEVYGSLQTYFDENQLIPASVDSIAYVETIKD